MAPFERDFPVGAVAGVEVEPLDAAGSGGSTTSTTWRTGAGASAGGKTDGGTKVRREPGWITKMGYESFTSLLEQGLPA